MHDIEAELVKALKFKKKIEDRQEYLTEILKAMDDRKRFTDKDYDNLSEEAADWHQAAVAAKDADDEVPDFDGTVDHEAAEAADQTEEDDDADEELEAEEDPDSSLDEDDAGGDEQADDDETSEDEGRDSNGDESAEDPPGMGADESEELKASDEEPEDDEAEDTEEQILKKAKKIAKQAPSQAVKKPVAAQPKKAAPVQVNAKPVQKGTFPEPDYGSLNNSRNRFGTVKGTKTDEAIKMYVKGASGKQIMDRLGGRYYNILKKLVKEGHKVEKTGDTFTLTHRDDVKARKAK